MDFDPLNGVLYRLLKRRFGTVKVANQGEALLGDYKLSHTKDNGMEQLDVTQPGEYYMINCPFCNDTKFRMYINHMWGVRDKRTKDNNLWLAICYNEKCLNSYERRMDLLEEINALEYELGTARIRKGKEVRLEDVKMDWPGPVTRLDKLPRGHEARHYLIGRGFDPDRIGRFYNVHYCYDSFRWLARDRIIIPIYENGEMKGWQARYVGEMNWKKEGAPPKYYSAPGMPRRLVIYNLANAAEYETGVVVEGPTDVWGFGPMACCTLGATMTVQQQMRFISKFRHKSAVLLYDPEEYETDASKKLVTALAGRFEKGFCAVKLPKGKDPGSLERTFMRDYVADQAAKQGVKVSWERSDA